MKIVYGMLADFALGHSDGRLYIVGGGISRLAVPTLPWTHPAMSVVVRVQYEPEEVGREDELVIGLVDPKGVQRLERDAFPIRAVENPDDPGAAPAFHCVLNTQQMLIDVEGEWTWTVHIANRLRYSIPMRVRLVPGAAGYPPESQQQ